MKKPTEKEKLDAKFSTVICVLSDHSKRLDNMDEIMMIQDRIDDNNFYLILMLSIAVIYLLWLTSWRNE